MSIDFPVVRTGGGLGEYMAYQKEPVITNTTLIKVSKIPIMVVGFFRAIFNLIGSIFHYALKKTAQQAGIIEKYPKREEQYIYLLNVDASSFIQEKLYES